MGNICPEVIILKQVVDGQAKGQHCGFESIAFHILDNGRLLHPFQRDNRNYAARGTHYAARGLHCAARGLP